MIYFFFLFKEKMSGIKGMSSLQVQRKNGDLVLLLMGVSSFLKVV